MLRDYRKELTTLHKIISDSWEEDRYCMQANESEREQKMTKWNLKINISKEMKELKDFTQNMSDETELEDDFVAIAEKFKNKFLSYETEIKETTEDDGTFEDLESELENFIMSFDVDNANYSMENIYQICDCAGIWLIQY